MELKNNPIPVVEMFSSIQGEGPRLRPAIFIRTALCCFKCPGFGCKLTAPDGSELLGCDTIRAVSSKFKGTWTYYDNYRKIVNEADKLIFDSLRKFTNNGLHHCRINHDVVFTGGEPLLWWNNKTYQDTLAYFISRGHVVTIETNGALDIDFFREYQKHIIFSVSVKLENSGELKERRINIETLTKIFETCPNSYLKFVINPETWDIDSKEIFELLEQIPYYVDVYLMPLGANQQQLQQNTKFVVEKCVENGFNYSDRSHIRAWNTLEGV